MRGGGYYYLFGFEFFCGFWYLFFGGLFCFSRTGLFNYTTEKIKPKMDFAYGKAILDAFQQWSPVLSSKH